jgi:hypothetical protein
MTASDLCFKAGVLLLLAGVLWGIHMGISQNHSAMPAHAHLNLLGFVALFLFGIYYRLHPKAEANPWALRQVLVWIASTIVLVIGVGLVHAGHANADPVAAVGSLAIFADTALFAWIVFKV